MGRKYESFNLENNKRKHKEAEQQIRTGLLTMLDIQKKRCLERNWVKSGLISLLVIKICSGV